MIKQDRITLAILTISQTQTIMFEIFDVERAQFFIPFEFQNARFLTELKHVAEKWEPVFR